MTRYKHPYNELRARVEEDIAGHVLTVVKDDGRYRHLRFKSPDGSFYWFDLVTWPGVLVFNGDMGSYMFSRVADMFQFFRGPYINPGYWGEKLQAHDGYKEFSEEILGERVREFYDEHVEGHSLEDRQREVLWDEIEYQVLGASSTESAHEALYNFNEYGLEFVDSWDWKLEDYTYQYLWACQAILWGIGKYRKATCSTTT